RIINNFMVQGGDIFSKDDSMKNRWGQGGPGYAIEDEFIEGLSNTVGTIAMANSGPNTGGSQFFINLIDNSRLDWDKGDPRSKHPVFGEIIEGMDIVEKIGKVKTVRDLPVEPVIINSVELIKK
ncbi:peptidylprolyl isomerase, partial [Candidatus Parcubacteria bacterium]|nr:peptidylprolyl isomerase [Candidatus Parcubacteria bacterium]